MKLLTVVTLLAAFVVACAPAATNTPAPTTTPEPEILSHVLEVISDPEGAAKFVFNPKAIGQGLFVHGRTVTIDVLLQPGWQIDKWVGPVFDVVEESAKIKMDSSQTVVVRLVPASTRVNTPAPISERVANPSPTRNSPSTAVPAVAQSPTLKATVVPPESPTATPTPIYTPIPSPTSLPTPTTKPTVTPTTTPTPVPPARGKVLFQDNFESGIARNWEYLGDGLSIVRDTTGNYVLQSTSTEDQYPAAGVGGGTWRDYAIEFRVRFVDFLDINTFWDLQVNIRRDDSRPVCTRYTIWFEGNKGAGINLDGSGGKGCIRTSLAKVSSFSLVEGEWYSVLIEAVGPNINVYFDGKLILHGEAVDEPFLQGSILFKGGRRAIVQFDDFRVVELLPR